VPKLLLIMVSPDCSSVEKSGLDRINYSQDATRALFSKSDARFKTAGVTRRSPVVLLVIACVIALVNFLGGTRFNITPAFPSTKPDIEASNEDFNWAKVSMSTPKNNPAHQVRQHRFQSSTSNPAMVTFSVRACKCHSTTGTVRLMLL